MMTNPSDQSWELTSRKFVYVTDRKGLETTRPRTESDPTDAG